MVKVTPCDLKLSAFCVVDNFVAEDPKRRTGTGVARSKGYITCQSRGLTVHRRWQNAPRLSDSAKPQFLVCSSLGLNRWQGWRSFTLPTRGVLDRLSGLDMTMVSHVLHRILARESPNAPPNWRCSSAGKK